MILNFEAEMVVDEIPMLIALKKKKTLQQPINQTTQVQSSSLFDIHSYTGKFPLETNSNTSLINLPVIPTLNLPKHCNRKIVQDPTHKTSNHFNAQQLQ